MKLIRRTEVQADGTDIPNIGDQLVIELEGLGRFTATAQGHDQGGTWFIFDDCVARRKMNERYTNIGGYENSDLSKWIKDELLKKFPEEIKVRIMEISIPTYGQIFGHDEFYQKYIEPDDDEQFLLMKERKNAIACYDNETAWYWLKNATKRSVSSACFACVNDFGIATYYGAGNTFGVRPAFLFV